MRFRNEDYPKRKNELSDTVSEEHPLHMAVVAEERIMAMHHHNDGSKVELHEVGSREFIQQSISGSLEGKLGGSFEFSNDTAKKEAENFNAPKIEYERKTQGSQLQQLYGAQQSVTGASHHQETVMMGCNCGAEWTVTGQSMKQADGHDGIKIEQYGSAAGGAAGYNAAQSGAGGERIKYAASGGQQQDYKG